EKFVVGRTKQPTEVRATMRAARDRPGITGEPGVLVGARIGDGTAGRLAKTGDAKAQPERIDEVVLLGAVHGDSLIHRRDRLPAAGAKKAPLLKRNVAALSQKLALARGGALAVEKIVRRDGGVLHADRFRSTASKVPLSTGSVEMESGELCSFASAKIAGRA